MAPPLPAEGDLDSPGGPVTPTMKTLQELWDRIVEREGPRIQGSDADATFTNCTLTGNSARDGGGIFAWKEILKSGTARS